MATFELRKLLAALLIALAVGDAPALDRAEASAASTDFAFWQSPETSPVDVDLPTARRLARVEAKRADRVLGAMESRHSYSSQEYRERLGAIIRRYEAAIGTDANRKALVVQALSTELASAYAGLEASIDDVSEYLVIARAADPDADEISVPSRFVHRSSERLPEPEPWTELDYKIWT